MDCGKSLSRLLPAELALHDDPRQKALVQELAFGTLRWFYQLDAVLEKLMSKPLKTRDRDLHALLLIGLYQLRIVETATHAAVSETVEAARLMQKKWATGLVNAVLRNAQRRQVELDAFVKESLTANWAHPQWWVSLLQQDWPDHWQDILAANNQRPPMTLRVNREKIDAESYLQLLQKAEIEASLVEVADAAICLQRPIAVHQLPGFSEGLVSVQDAAAQMCADLLELQPGQRVLDACAAPGGKTCHILETEAALSSVLAIDKDARRLERVDENLQRLGLRATLKVADAAKPDRWWDGQLFDRILLDAPCSASGVVRRHPDIKLLRRESDIDALLDQQQYLLNALWPLLAPGGILLYATCSVFQQENANSIELFLGRFSDAREYRISGDWGLAQSVGRQILPGQQGMDGFYFARICKKDNVI